MKLDFLSVLNKEVNTLGLYAVSKIGTLSPTDSISLMAMPGGEEVVFMDGMRDKTYNIQIDAKSKRQDFCLDALTTIYQHLETLGSLPSVNGSYEFKNINTLSLPSLIMQDDQSYFICTVSISVEITIYKGVL